MEISSLPFFQTFVAIESALGSLHEITLCFLCLGLFWFISVYLPFVCPSENKFAKLWHSSWGQASLEASPDALHLGWWCSAQLQVVLSCSHFDYWTQFLQSALELRASQVMAVPLISLLILPFQNTMPFWTALLCPDWLMLIQIAHHNPSF